MDRESGDRRDVFCHLTASSSGVIAYRQTRELCRKRFDFSSANQTKKPYADKQETRGLGRRYSFKTDLARYRLL
jgi:hypothetical protein